MYPGTFAAKNPDRPALVMADTGETLTYGELEGRSVRLARVLRDAGLQKGDAVALLSENDPLYLVAYWAALRSGLYLVAINFHLTADEQAYILDDCGATVLLSSTGQAGRAADIADRVPGVRTRLFGADVDRAIDAASGAPLGDQPAGADMLYSSGTTGLPKGVQPPLPRPPGRRARRHLRRRCSADVRLRRGHGLPLAGTDVPRGTAALQHGHHGASAARWSSWRRFDAEQALALIEQHRATHSQWVPTMFVRMLKLPDDVRRKYDVSSLRGRDPRRGAVPGRGQAADDRVVGPDPLRVLRRHRGDRAHLDHPAGLA